MWFKKKANISGYNPNTAVDGTDWRIDGNENNWSVSQTLLSAADTGNYFYLPALGNYTIGLLNNVGNNGTFWSSSANPWDSDSAYFLRFSSGYVFVNYDYRYNGFRAESCE